jgi:pyruvate dehydrogenase E2 component (dihydrolipoamide acetyltransferase)
MDVEFVLPSLGADMEGATLTQWLKQPGDPVRRGEPLATVETTKGLIDIESYDDGQVLQHLVQPGTRVPVGHPLARLAVEAGAPAVAAAPLAPPPASAPEAGPSTPEVSARAVPGPAEGRATRTRMSPAARRRAHELGLPLETLAQTAGGGIVHVAEVEKMAARTPASASEARGAMRAAIGATMARSKREIPHYYLAHRVNFHPAREWVTRYNATRSVKERLLEGVLIVKAVALAAARIEGFSGTFHEGRFHPSAAVHLGTAIAIRGGGLVAPALLDAHQKDLPTLMHEFSALVERVRAGHLRSGEFTAATLTLTSLGADGVDALYPIINPPQVAIVGAGEIRDQPWAENGQLAVRAVLTLTLAADHRVTDGRSGARFLRTIADLLTDPQSL